MPTVFTDIPSALAADLSVWPSATKYTTLRSPSRLAARYFFHYELPKTTAQLDLLDNGDRTTADLDENWF